VKFVIVTGAVVICSAILVMVSASLVSGSEVLVIVNGVVVNIAQAFVRLLFIIAFSIPLLLSWHTSVCPR